MHLNIHSRCKKADYIFMTKASDRIRIQMVIKYIYGCCFYLICRKAADQGHPHASYNLAVGHLKGYKTDVKEGYVVLFVSFDVQHPNKQLKSH